MAKTPCLICGDPSGSREHVLPAALGGRRVDRGIYCKRCNNGFSPLALSLSQQLALLNAQLGVRPDHHRSAREAVLTTEAGEPVRVSTAGVRRETRGTGGGPIVISLGLGGPEALKSIAYVALTFLAHRLPDVSRQPGLEPIKRYVTGDVENTFAWWESDAFAAGLPASPFAFGHTVVLTVSAETGQAMAAVSFFGAMVFGVELGRVDAATSQTETTFIDPQAELPADICRISSAEIDVRITKPEPLQTHLMDGPETVARRLDGLQKRIRRRRFNHEMQEDLRLFNASRQLPPQERRQVVSEAVGRHPDRVYELFRAATRILAERSEGLPALQELVEILESALVPGPSGLNGLGQVALGTAARAMAGNLDDRLDRSPLAMDDLWEVFGSGGGAAVVMQAVIAVLFDPQHGVAGSH